MGYYIQKANLNDDSELIIDFCKRNLPSWPDKKYRWFYLENIHGPADCYMLKETGSDNLVGCQAIFPRRVYYNGKPFRAGIIGDLAVDKRHRSIGPALQLLKAAVASSRNGQYAFFYGCPTQRSEHVTRRAGFRMVGNYVRMARVLHSEPYISRKVRAPYLIPFAGKVLDHVAQIFVRETKGRKEQEYQSVVLGHSNESFDELWDKCLKNYRLIGERSHAFLTWRFTNCPFRQYRFFCLKLQETDSLVGYIVYHEQDGVIQLCDILAESSQILEQALLPSFLRFVRKSENSSVSISFMGCGDILSALKRFHFRRRSDNSFLIAMSGNQEGFNQLFYDPSHWYFLRADDDV